MRGIYISNHYAGCWSYDILLTEALLDLFWEALLLSLSSYIFSGSSTASSWSPLYVKLSKCMTFKSSRSMVVSVGVFLMSWLRNIFEICLVSPFPLTLGLIGAGYSLFKTFVQFIFSKKGCDFIALTPPNCGDPRRVFGFLSSKRKSKFCKLLESQSLGSNYSWTISFIVTRLDRLLNGGTPTAISWMSIPSPHQSTILLYPFFKITSGARYYVVPHKVFV